MIPKVLGGLKRGLIFVVSAPAGTGKTTLVRMLSNEFPCVVESVSYTTRKPRHAEKPGLDYHYVSVEEFELMIQDEDFLEYAKVFDNYYGTSKTYVETQRNLGKHVILVIDTQGALQLMDKLKAVYVFISPPSLEELRGRLHGRKADNDESIEKRLSWAEKEIALAPRYDYHIVNDHLAVAYDALRAILIAEEHKTRV